MKLNKLISCVVFAASFSSAGAIAALPGGSDTLRLDPSLDLIAFGKKDTYLNQSQDRLIKKGSFKDAGVEGTVAIPNKENGIFVSVGSKDIADQAKMNALLGDSRINGVSATLTWRQLEPEDGKLDWQALDSLISLLAQHNKGLILRVATCGVDCDVDRSDTPDWVYEDGAKFIGYKDTTGKERKMPIYWDSVYLAKWSNFVRALAERYDNNPVIQSVGITGGGSGISSALIPVPPRDKVQFDAIAKTLKSDYNANPHQLVEEWKYVADLFPSAFKVTRLNFAINPLMPDRSGEEMLDELSDYLIYRYGQRIYLTRQNVDSAKHGFDQYRVLAKFRPDTLCGYQLAPEFPASDLDKMVKNCLDDGVSFVEIPAALLDDKEAAVADSLNKLRSRLGYQLISQKVTLPDAGIKSGAPLKAGFVFTNVGDIAPMRPSRQMEKDVPASYKIQLELRDSVGKPVLLSLHTPTTPTNKWEPGKAITWEEDLKMPKLQAGEYTVWISLVDADTKRKILILDSSGHGQNAPDSTIPVGKVQIVD